MEVTIVLATLLNLFTAPDLCTEAVYLDADNVPIVDYEGTTLSRYCTWTEKQRAPVWSDEVCCDLGPDSAYCTPTNALGECSPGQAKRWCDYAEHEGSQVTCFQAFPSACDAGLCDALPVGAQPEASAPLCCWNGTCFELMFDEFCAGVFFWCDSPYTNADGTVGCADWD